MNASGVSGPYRPRRLPVTLPRAMGVVRDTKDRDGGTLTFGPAAWAGFVDLAKAIGPVG